MSSKITKMVIVGDEQCGKSSLCSAFQNNPFVEESISTVFEDFEATIDINGQQMKLALYELAGNGDCGQLRHQRLSYHEATVVLICFSIGSPESLKNVEDKWVKDSRYFCAGKPVILVGNKADLRKRDSTQVPSQSHIIQARSSVTWLEGAQMASSIRAIRYRECSAKTGEGVHQIFETAMKIALKFSENIQGSSSVVKGICPQSPNPDPSSSSNLNPSPTQNTQSSSSATASDLPPTINLLLLGQTGVGKTTFLNSLHTYSSYESIEDALSDPNYNTLTRMKCTINDVTVESTGLQNQLSQVNESYDEVGQAVTQHPFCHNFVSSSSSMYNRKIRIIDTPGLGDPRGMAKDEENFNQLLSVLQSVEQIHGILILLNPNESRSDLTFDYCIQQLLSNLPRHAAAAFIFIFTKADRVRTELSCDTKHLLQSLFRNIEDSRGAIIPMEKKNTFYFNNLAIPYILSKRSPHFQHSDWSKDHIKYINNSWSDCLKEMDLLFKHLHKIRPISTACLMSVKSARNLVEILQGPLLQVCKVIEGQIKEMADLEAEIKEALGLYDFSLLIEKGLHTTTFSWNLLKEPRVVCNECSLNVLTLEGKKPFNISTCCHGCTVPAFPLLGFLCQSMDLKQWRCKKCLCKWSAHSKVRYASRILRTPDQEFADAVEAASSPVDKLAVVSQELKNLKKEKAQILSAAVAFTGFIQANAIIYQSDAMERLIQRTIDQETREPSGMDLKSLHVMLQNFKERVKIQREVSQRERQEVAKEGSGRLNSIAISGPEEIQQVLRRLCDLKRQGPAIKELYQRIFTQLL